ncbi:Fe-S cluster assembly sulfur transfer protein SufU [Listeria booriae]|uniref:SUF system NifU family Fe-S cluster assembly protein n=1 Tax=Listeria booriae TaxID=1552123 RepID=A0A7X0WGE5_9LIST|nr:SUF system NifU family Fe-S cluster assembly protein [Listeria booriae]MBC1333365.1 SUF system NifU family Fe-S cluster assembly protein [Listeria booriae]MBC1898627.1 SUF system NifU family Fe-S cluster assembly protein [Listeria booriae]MBC2100563.1 SUF system NifU family Fe-S cluster assembly protein [Listeria booriae]MBC2161139.1 SUF system NifU family Fe-S cluster assembly protein [Listeria booriae]MBC2161456.1 SUF system NifU family Fe-S cluster assembly protein [Listeria booriae]
MSSRKLDQLYRQVIMDHYKNPRNNGTLDDESVTIDLNNPTCGDEIHLHLKMENQIITDAKFTGSGCSISMASASMMTESIIGKSEKEALKMSRDFSEMVQGHEHDIVDENGDVEALAGVAKFPARIKCATLSWKAMERAIFEFEGSK